jgi:DNA (cytosine-5)-methyltransferase 1
MSEEKIKVSSWFSGCAGLDKLFAEDDSFEIDSFSEIDKHPSAVLKYHHPDIENLGDIENIKIKSLRPVDVLLAGFPCTGVSTQGKQEGMANLRTALVRHLFPIIKQTKPKFILLENVKNLLSKDMQGVYNAVKNQIEKQGYYCYTETKDSSKYGSSQQRVRVIMYFVRKDFKEARKNYHDDGKQGSIKIKSFTRCLRKENKYISWSKSHRTNKDKETGEVTKHLDFRIREDGLINTLTTGSGCVGASTGTIVMLPDGSTRYLTPEEGEGLQTWKRNHTKFGLCDMGKRYEIPEGARYRMIGNGVPSNIVINHREEIKYLMGLK